MKIKGAWHIFCDRDHKADYLSEVNKKVVRRGFPPGSILKVFRKGGWMKCHSTLGCKPEGCYQLVFIPAEDK